MSKPSFLLINQTQFEDTFLPLGVLKVATAIQNALSEKGIEGEVKILDPIDAMNSREHLDRFLERLRSEAASSTFVGFSDFTFYSEEPLRTHIRAVREANAQALVALGGWGPTLSPGYYSTVYAPDLIVEGTFGEAPATVRAMVGDLAAYAHGEVDKKQLFEALSAVPGLFFQGRSTGPVEVSSSHDPVNWDVRSFSVDPEDYITGEPDTARFPYEVRKGETPSGAPELLIPFQFYRISCPNHWKRPGCTFCAMAEQASRLRREGRLPAVLNQMDPEAVGAELRRIAGLFDGYRIHLFIVDDSLTPRAFRAIKEALFESGLVDHLYLVSIFVRPDVLSDGYLETMDELGERGIKLKLFVGLDFMVKRLNEISNTRKRIEKYPTLAERLQRHDCVEVVFSFIQNHPMMTPSEFKEHLDQIRNVAFTTDALISIAPFIFLSDSIHSENEKVPIIYRNYYMSRAVKDVLNIEPKPLIERFHMGPDELAETLDIIDSFVETLHREKDALVKTHIHEANFRQLLFFLPIMEEYVVWHLRVYHPEFFESSETLKSKLAEIPTDALANDPEECYPRNRGPG